MGSDVVGLVGEGSGNVGLSSGDGEERSEVSDSEGLGVGHCEEGQGVSYDDRDVERK